MNDYERRMPAVQPKEFIDRLAVVGTGAFTKYHITPQVVFYKLLLQQIETTCLQNFVEHGKFVRRAPVHMRSGDVSAFNRSDLSWGFLRE